MSIITSPLQEITLSRNLVNLEAVLFYPKLILFENKNVVHVLDLLTKNVKEPDKSEYSFVGDEIIDKVFHNNHVWLILRTNKVVVMDVDNGFKSTVYVDNHKLSHFLKTSETVFLISESGECLNLPYKDQELSLKLKAGSTEEIAVLEKAPVQHNAIKYNNLINPQLGLEFTNENNIVVKCPITKLSATISVNMPIHHLVPWDEAIVLAHDQNMWVADLKNGESLFTFPNNGLKCYPVSIHDYTLYYITYKATEIQICCARNTSMSPLRNLADEVLDRSIAKISSQEKLKIQLTAITEDIITEKNPIQVTQLQSYFDNIEDYNFLIVAAYKLCQHNLAYKSILYSLQNKVYAAGNTDLVTKLADLVIKVDLLEYICFKDNKNYQNTNLFDKDVTELCIMFISNHDLDLASICWLKYNEVKLTINSEDVLEILYSIPHNIKMGSLLIWLKNFVPLLLDENPFFIDLFVKWTMERILKLEQSGYWPKIGLKFIEDIINVLELSLKMIAVRPVSMDDLDILKDRINYILELKEKYKINMLLSELSSQSPNEVALIMLRRCYNEDLEIFLRDYLPSYAARHLFELDDTLRAFIESEAALSGGGVDSFRLKVVLSAFRSTTSKLECLLQVLKVLHVPWDSNVLELAVAAAASATKDFTVTDIDRTLAQEVQKELNYANVKVVLKKYNFPLTCTDYMLVLNKIMRATPVDLNDLKIITGVMTNFKNYGNILFIDKCLHSCETRNALDYFNNLTNKEKTILIKTVMNKYEQIISGDTCNLTLEKNYLDFLKGTQLLNEIQITTIENLYYLKNSYDITVTLNNLYIEEAISGITSIWMRKDGHTASSAQGGCVSQLTRTEKSRDSILSNLLRRTSTNHDVRKLLENILYSQSSDDAISALNSFKNGKNSLLLMNSFRILVELLIKCEESYMHYLIKYLSILNALLNADTKLKNLSVAWKFQYIYLPMSSIKSMNEFIDFIEKYISQNILMVDACHILDGHDFIPFRMVSYIIQDLIITGQIFTEDLYAMRDKITRKVLTKAVLSQDLDEVLLTNLLLILSKFEEVNDSMWLIDTLKGQGETLSPAFVRFLSSPVIRRTFALEDSFGNTVPYQPQHLLKVKFNINLADIALPENTEETWDVKVILFCVLKQYPNTSFDKLVQICRTLNISVNDGLSLQLVSLLSSWELNYKLFNDNLNCRQISFGNTEKEIMSQCLIIWENIDDKDLIKDILNDFWKNGEVCLHGRTISINPYYYEVYLCIFNLLFGKSTDLRDMKEYFLLNFLKDYRRKSPPKQYEFELFSVKGMFPEVGYYRLPFPLFMRDDMWSNLKSEITLETYERWIPVVALLSLDADLQTARDMICSNALKQTMTSRKNSDGCNIEASENEPWRLTTREEPLLRSAHRCVRHIANMEWAGACLFYVLQGCARGADQVAAAQLCYQFAQRWAAVQPGNRAVRQMERLHLTLSTRHALHKIEWVCEEFVRLSTEPAQLIRALYLHPSFVEKMSRHDINRAATEIADKNGINISSIRFQILENILDKTYEENKNKKNSGLNRKDLLTAKYILKATCPKMGAIYLSRIVFDDESDFNKCKKLRALQCLMSVIEADTAVKVTNRGREDLWKFLLELLSVVNLENEDLPWVVSTFMQDKIRAIEQLLQAGTNVEGLKVAAELARRYGNVQIIRELIPLLLRAGLYEVMTPLLLRASSPPNEVICAAWRAVIVSPFQRADYPITERQKIHCLTAINLLPVCPIIKDEDLLEIWKNCLRCKCVGIGCLVLPYMTSKTRSSLSELQRIDKRNLIASLKNLHAETYLVSSAMYVIENMSFKGQQR
ncbi:uncharacterized protein LOC114364395 [Ostrinia furnacalis]|uniref:uncharacterized protein LOC114364395 n=1 Tax=Ostrinia furnacalis TaxID=93504 RepID=UPI00103D13E2|nr:uncharacterized protein LOC114364395 [Ostrinia furnacalis]